MNEDTLVLMTVIEVQQYTLDFSDEEILKFLKRNLVVN